MKNCISFILICVSLLVFKSCQKDSAVSLAVDFTSRDSWKYEFTCDIGGNFSRVDSVSNLSSTIQCILIGQSTKERDRINIKAEKVHVTSNILDEVEIQHVTEQLKNTGCSISLNFDPNSPHDSLILPKPGLSEWDLYRQLVKLLPSLPEKPVRPGFSWEREKQFPLITSQGEANCEVYQSFTFDSLRTTSDNRQEACISWLFRYAIDEKQFDTTSLIDNLPLSGNGKGTAVLNVNEKSLLRAGMVFTTPVCSLENLSVNWEEKASLALIKEDVSEDK